MYQHIRLFALKVCFMRTLHKKINQKKNKKQNNAKTKQTKTTNK